MRTVIGIDYGTGSARAVLTDAETGGILISRTIPYPHGVMEGALASIEDYDGVLMELLEAVTPAEYRETVTGICADATSLTLVVLGKDGVPLAKTPAFAGREQAQVKLWKRHAAQSQADEALKLAKEMNEPFLGRTGGTISCEWTLPKLMEIYDRDQEVFDAADIAFDLCEYLTWRLTGKLARSVGSMSYKGLWAEDLGLPSKEYLNALRPGLAEKYALVMRGDVLKPGDMAGTVSGEIRERFGLRPDVKVAAGVLDGHTSLVALGALEVGDAALVIGTSTVLTLQTPELKEVEGICGIAKDGLVPGMYGIDAGQSCTGDMLEWYMNNMLPVSVWKEAEEKGVSPHNVLMERIGRPWECRLSAADWWNGSRNAPCDLELRGGMTGFSLETKPEDIYLALLQGIVCGAGEIVDACAAYGVETKRVRITGGIAGKNPLLMQQFADILEMPVEIGLTSDGPAIGSAIFAAVAAGIYSTVKDAWEKMGIRRFKVYEPDEEYRTAYREIRRRNRALRMKIREERF